jgi:hypothetical protein
LKFSLKLKLIIFVGSSFISGFLEKRFKNNTLLNVLHYRSVCVTLSIPILLRYLNIFLSRYSYSFAQQNLPFLTRSASRSETKIYRPNQLCIKSEKFITLKNCLQLRACISRPIFFKLGNNNL